MIAIQCIRILYTSAPQRLFLGHVVWGDRYLGEVTIASECVTYDQVLDDTQVHKLFTMFSLHTLLISIAATNLSIRVTHKY